jgi:hypothetical protein
MTATPSLSLRRWFPPMIVAKLRAMKARAEAPAGGTRWDRAVERVADGEPADATVTMEGGPEAAAALGLPDRMRLRWKDAPPEGVNTPGGFRVIYSIDLYPDGKGAVRHLSVSRDGGTRDVPATVMEHLRGIFGLPADAEGFTVSENSRVRHILAPLDAA